MTKMLAIDTETTGIDFFHSARPFFITTCTVDGELVNWQTEVDPHTRMPKWSRKDIRSVCDYLAQFDLWIFHNANFDIHALKSIGIDLTDEWHKVRDTLYAGHLLQSKEAHDLGTMSVRYLGHDISKYEKSLEFAVKACRRRVDNKGFVEKHGVWKKAREGYADAPSMKEKTWQADYWLPAAVAKAEKLPEDHEYWTVLSDYAGIDSSVTLPIWLVQQAEMEKRGLVEHYETRLKLLPIVHDMESRGVTVNKNSFIRMMEEFSAESRKAAAVCLDVAKSYDYELTLPKAGNNKSLLTFASVLFTDVGHEIEIPKTDAGNISLDKYALESLELQLPDDSKALDFVQSLKKKRRCDTAVGYMQSYERFWLPLDQSDPMYEEFYVLHSRLNVTGSSTLRWTSEAPNEQNISKQQDFNLRYGFGPPPGREWWSLDAKNIELRIPAYESEEDELISLFERPDDAPYYGSTHLLNFHTVYPDIWDDVEREVGFERVGPTCKKRFESTWYKWCKNGGFAIQYGAVERKDAVGTADRAFRRVGSHARLKARFGRLETLNQAQINHAERYGYVETIPDATVNPHRGYPLVCSRTKWGGVLPTVPLSYHVQGTAMWWMMMAMIRCQEWISNYNSQRPENEHIYFVLQVHDELVFDLPAGGRKNLKIVNQLRKLMEKGGEGISIPTPVSMSYHPNNWKEEVELTPSLAG